jgi:gluconate 2-dehydrogenase gamma chain
VTDFSRRELLKRAGAASAAAAVPGTFTEAAQSPAPAAPVREPLETLTQAEAETLEAVVARLIPTDANGPGAREARAAHYIDRALGGALAGSRDAYRAGLAALDAHARGTKGRSFAQLPEADQDQMLTALEQNAVPGFAPGSAVFFNLVLAHTLQGTFGDPYYGGNKNFVGWELVGYPGVRLAVTADEQRLGQRPRQLKMSAYDYSMFSGRKPSRAEAETAPAGPVHHNLGGLGHGD